MVMGFYFYKIILGKCSDGHFVKILGTEIWKRRIVLSLNYKFLFLFYSNYSKTENENGIKETLEISGFAVFYSKNSKKNLLFKIYIIFFSNLFNRKKWNNWKNFLRTRMVMGKSLFHFWF